MGAKNQIMYVVKENGKYLVLGSTTDEEDIALEALLHINANDLDGARKWLDWARSDMKVEGGDDPLAGSMFPRMWTRGQDADADTMRAAALSMIGKRHDAKLYIPAIIVARDKAKTDVTRAYLERALAQAYESDENYTELRASALRLLQAYPTSDVARYRLYVACSRLKDWATITQAIQTRLDKVPDDDDAQGLLAEVYSDQGKFEEANAIFKQMLDAGRGGPNNMNSFAWNQLLMNKITPEGLEQARRGVSLDKSYDMIHTLAAIYAENGNPQEARQLVLGILEQYGMNEPDGPLWYVFGRVAEAYGQPQAALACYKRVDWKEKYTPEPNSTYMLAQKRLTGLTGAETAVGAK
jgi:tetratricopeptide (TPR) repeat protein